MTDLRPCPFCGYDRQEIKVYDAFGDYVPLDEKLAISRDAGVDVAELEAMDTEQFVRWYEETFLIGTVSICCESCGGRYVGIDYDDAVKGWNGDSTGRYRWNSSVARYAVRRIRTSWYRRSTRARGPTSNAPTSIAV